MLAAAAELTANRDHGSTACGCRSGLSLNMRDLLAVGGPENGLRLGLGLPKEVYSVRDDLPEDKRRTWDQ